MNTYQDEVNHLYLLDHAANVTMEQLQVLVSIDHSTQHNQYAQIAVEHAVEVLGFEPQTPSLENIIADAWEMLKKLFMKIYNSVKRLLGFGDKDLAEAKEETDAAEKKVSEVAKDPKRVYARKDQDGEEASGPVVLGEVEPAVLRPTANPNIGPKKSSNPNIGPKNAPSSKVDYKVTEIKGPLKALVFEGGSPIPTSLSVSTKVSGLMFDAITKAEAFLTSGYSENYDIPDISDKRGNRLDYLRGVTKVKGRGYRGITIKDGKDNYGNLTSIKVVMNFDPKKKVIVKFPTPADMNAIVKDIRLLVDRLEMNKKLHKIGLDLLKEAPKSVDAARARIEDANKITPAGKAEAIALLKNNFRVLNIMVNIFCVVYPKSCIAAINTSTQYLDRIASEYSAK